MKMKSVKTEQFFGLLAQRKEYVLTKARNLDKIEIERTWKSEAPDEETDWVKFPINAEMIFVRKYEDDQRTEASIEKIQNGKTITILEMNEYLDNISAEEYGEFFEEFNRQVENFKKKGFVEIA